MYKTHRVNNNYLHRVQCGNHKNSNRNRMYQRTISIRPTWFGQGHKRSEHTVQ